jgi:hypothetical protein
MRWVTRTRYVHARVVCVGYDLCHTHLPSVDTGRQGTGRPKGKLGKVSRAACTWVSSKGTDCVYGMDLEAHDQLLRSVAAVAQSKLLMPLLLQLWSA